MDKVYSDAADYVRSHFGAFSRGEEAASDSAIAAEARRLGHDEDDFALAVSEAAYNEFAREHP